MKEVTRLKLNQLQVIVLAWMVMGFLITVYDYLVILSNNSLGPSEEYSFLMAAIRNVGAGLIGALTGGSFLVFHVNVKYRDKPYGYTVVAVTVVFVLVVAFITYLMGSIFVPLRTGKPLLHPDSQAALRHFLVDTHPFKSALAWSFVVAISQLLLQVNTKFGQPDFWNIIRGRYNKPKEEKRIFMFLDINSSTEIAERLGDETYHALLKDFFADLTDPILENRGSIYQYVGDEVVIAWDFEQGIRDANCIRCFFDMKQQLQKAGDKYRQRYGLVPSFKAGLHCGRVIAGEVGIIKRDITYSGDVLNTTSRICNKCGELGEELLASSDVLSALQSMKAYLTKPLGSIKLKGKSREVLLNSLVPFTA